MPAPASKPLKTRKLQEIRSCESGLLKLMPENDILDGAKLNECGSLWRRGRAIKVAFTY